MEKVTALDTEAQQNNNSLWYQYKTIFINGIWHNNQALVAMLGLCPLLAVSNSLVNGIGMGIATLFVVITSNCLIALVARFLQPEVRIAIFVTIIASSVTAIDLLMQAYLPQLHLALGIFIPLIVTNCLILARAESFARKNNLIKSLIDGIAIGLGFALVLILMGALREILAHGTLLSQADILFGAGAQERLTITLFDQYSGVLLAILPPGAFIILGILIATKNLLQPPKK